MNKKHEEVLKSVSEWLDNVDPDKFINDLLEIQEQSSGPTCEEFIASFDLKSK